MKGTSKQNLQARRKDKRGKKKKNQIKSTTHLKEPPKFQRKHEINHTSNQQPTTPTQSPKPNHMPKLANDHKEHKP